MPEVSLTVAELMEAALVGAMRRVNSIKRGGRHEQQAFPGTEPGAWTVDIEGAAGEMALAKYLRLYWSDGSYRGDDVGNFQVRTSIRRDGRLILYEKDGDEKAFVLVRGYCGQYEIAGWCFAYEGKKDEHIVQRNGGSPAYFVPSSTLRHIDTLLEMTA